MSKLTMSREDDVKSTTSKLFCALDAQRRNKQHIDSYTEMTKDFSGVLLTLVGMAYPSSQVYRNYRKDFIAIKVDSPTMHDKASSTVAALDEYCTLNRVFKAQSGRHIIYRIPK
jgi:hypothetical protein